MESQIDIHWFTFFPSTVEVCRRIAHLRRIHAHLIEDVWHWDLEWFHPLDVWKLSLHLMRLKGKIHCQFTMMKIISLVCFKKTDLSNRRPEFLTLPVDCFFFGHQKFQLPKMEVLYLRRLFLGWDFPFHKPYTYSFNMWVITSILGTWNLLMNWGCWCDFSGGVRGGPRLDFFPVFCGATGRAIREDGGESPFSKLERGGVLTVMEPQTTSYKCLFQLFLIFI